MRLGGYVAQNCKSNIQNLSSVLLSLQDALKPVLADLKSKRPSAAYKAFFKKAAYAPYVRKIFSNLLGPVAVTTKSHSTAQTPIFVCIDSLEQLVWDEKQEEIDAYDFCTSDSLIPAAMILPTPYIIICPMFFEEPAIPTVTNTSCMSLDPKEPYLFTYDGRSPVEYQPWHLLHELVHFYVYASKDTYKDFYGVNECIYLKGRTAILNPQSYSYYAASKYGHLPRSFEKRLALWRSILMTYNRPTIRMHYISKTEPSDTCSW